MKTDERAMRAWKLLEDVASARIPHERPERVIAAAAIALGYEIAVLTTAVLRLDR